MRMKGMRTLLAVGLSIALTAGVVVAQGGRPGGGQGGPGGQRRGFGGVTGVIEKVSKTELTLRVQQPQGGQRAVAPMQGGDQQPRSVTYDLTDETRYVNFEAGQDDDIELGKAIVAVGTGNENAITAKSLCTYKVVENDQDRFRVMGPLMLTMGVLMREAGITPQQGQRPPMAFGVVSSVAPLVIKTRGRDGAEREVRVTLNNATKYHKLRDIQNSDLKVGRTATVQQQFQRPPGGQGGPGGGRGNRQAPPAQGKPKAGLVMQHPAT